MAAGTACIAPREQLEARSAWWQRRRVQPATTL